MLGQSRTSQADARARAHHPAAIHGPRVTCISWPSRPGRPVGWSPRRHNYTGGGVGASRGWSVVVTNNARAGADASAFELQLPVAGSERLVGRVAVETSGTRDLEPVDLPSVSATGVVSAGVPAQSITTYVMSGAAAR